MQVRAEKVNDRQLISFRKSRLTALNVFYLTGELVAKDGFDKLVGVEGNRFVSTSDPEFNVNSIEWD